MTEKGSLSLEYSNHEYFNTILVPTMPCALRDKNDRHLSKAKYLSTKYLSTKYLSKGIA